MVETINLLFGTGLVLPIAWAGVKVGDEIALWSAHWARRGRL